VEARSIQRAALDAGTKTFAVLPFWVDPGAGPGTPRELVTRLYDALLYERMDDPPPVVGPIDRKEIHRAMDRLRVRVGDIPDRTAAAMGAGSDMTTPGWTTTPT
jgi:hypothetical protein